MARLALSSIVSAAALSAIGIACASTAQAAAPTAARPTPSTQAGPLSLDYLLSLRFLTPTVRDAKRQLTGAVTGLSPAPAYVAGLGSLLK
ncbi:MULTISPECIES: hypothetical protein [unclassified Streptomyces]|uniref:hypothetical protein n=1 Tax=unclassified Streptomyces TaxID=2593676 RepID=UPI002E34999D|nr:MULTISPECIES: hypothetical protein [unclassified Streptomyces]